MMNGLLVGRVTGRSRQWDGWNGWMDECIEGSRDEINNDGTTTKTKTTAWKKKLGWLMEV
jgi:hypothetical protein